MVAQVDELVRTLSRLPGYGRRSAERAALALLRKPELLSDPLVAALQAARKDVRCCPLCGGFTSLDRVPCDLCTDATRDDGLLCVVEEPADIVQIEKSCGFRGRYHALMGKISPAKKTGPSELRMDDLESRVAKGGIREVLIAVSTDVEGDNTASYILELLKPYGVRLSRLAFGLPADSGVGYSDPLTLKRAIAGRMNL
jgi:recombination protein RecR